MIRNLKILTLAAMMLGALSAVNAAQALAVPEFHCSVEPCRYTMKTDGTGATAHHVLVFKDSTGATVNITCESLTGEARTEKKTATELTFEGLKYDKCAATDTGKSTVTFDFNGCDYSFAAAGTLTIKCPAGKVIEATFTSGCVGTIGAQGPLKGITYHNAVVGGVNQITTEMKVAGIAATFDGTLVKCGVDPTKGPITGEYTTGNTLFPGETDPATETVVESRWE